MSSSEYSDAFEFYNTRFYFTDNGTDKGVIYLATKSGDGYSYAYFKDCTFDGISFRIGGKLMLVFENCEFSHSLEGTLDFYGENAHLFLYNCHLHNNSPDQTDFNNNVSSRIKNGLIDLDTSVRSWKYSAIGYRRSNCSAHVLNTIIEDYVCDNTVYANEDQTGNKIYYEHCTMQNTAGTGLDLPCDIKGRIAYNYFYNLGELRGKNGYTAKYDEQYGGYGVGGNAIFGKKQCREMRIYNNNIKNVMENAIEGHYYMVCNNTIESTGYRYDDAMTVFDSDFNKDKFTGDGSTTLYELTMGPVIAVHLVTVGPRIRNSPPPPSRG